MSLADDLSGQVGKILSQKWTVRSGLVVPDTKDVVLAGGSVKLDCTVLYADLSQSSRLATDFHRTTAAKVIRSFLYCMCRLVTDHDGDVTSFDGDRVMGVFVGDRKDTNAATCALKMNYVVSKIIAPRLAKYFTSLQQTGFRVSHCVGVDAGNVLVVRAGQRGSNDLVWVGRAPNLAARLSDVRKSSYRSYVTSDVYRQMAKSAKYGGKPQRLMWQKVGFPFLGKSTTAYRSLWQWKP